MLYYKSMLESKNKVFQNICKSLDQNEGIDSSDFKNKMVALNQRFADVAQRAVMWEQVS